tara:strand:- start:313 stop:450 length:138 start_codon:yes stop_codon:yes gene_type:complete
VQSKEELNRIVEVLSGAFIIGKCTDTPFVVKKKEKKNAKKETKKT